VTATPTGPATATPDGPSTPTAGGTGSTTTAAVADGEARALAAVLAAEDAAVYAYGVIGAQGSAASQAAALTALAAHAGQRDAVAAVLERAHRTPAPEVPGYRLPFAVTDDASARRLAAAIETALAAAQADLVSAADPSRRHLAAEWLAVTAVAAAAWGAQVTPFPGLPERS
jgi:hypothetical protein